MATKSKASKAAKAKKPVSKAKAPVKAAAATKSAMHAMTPSLDKNQACCMGLCSKCGSCCVCKMSVDNQVRAIVGAIIVLLIVLGHFFGETFFYITGLVGLLYCISGFTGKCHLRNCLCNIPCNKDKDKGK